MVAGAIDHIVNYSVIRGVTMATTRILDADCALLQELSAQTGKQQQGIIHEALAIFHREWLLDDLHTAFAQLKRDDPTWREEQAERAACDGTAAGGITSE